MKEKSIRHLMIAPLIAFAAGALLSGLYFSRAYKPEVSAGQALIESILNQNPSVQGKLLITQSFIENHSLIGYVLATKAVPTQPIAVLFTDSSGKFLINPATSVNREGETLQQIAFSKYIESSLAVEALQSITKTHYITQGNDTAPHKLWIVIDPNCIFCHKTYEDLQPFINSGTVAVRWVIIGLIKRSSADKAAAILSSPNPLAALSQNEAQFNDTTEEGGIPPLSKPSLEVQAQLTQNAEFVSKLVNVGTPVFIFKSHNIARLQEGYPGSPEATKSLLLSASQDW
jgi:thiol:disulfide interchange protein DsbG